VNVLKLLILILIPAAFLAIVGVVVAQSAASPNFPKIDRSKFHIYFDDIVRLEKCIYKPSNCPCCGWVDAIDNHFMETGLFSRDTPHDIYFPHSETKFVNGAKQLFILAPNYGVGITGRLYGCFGQKEKQEFDCFSNLGFSAHYGEVVNDKLEINLSVPTNGFIFWPTHNLWRVELDGLIVDPMFCVEDQFGKAKYYFQEDKSIKLVELQKKQNCRSASYKAKIDYFRKTYSPNY